MNSNKKNEGFAMIEVLLAVVILAIGLLAGSRMQMLGLSFSQGALTRSYATMAANDIIDRMQLNAAGVAAGNYDTVSTNQLPGNPNCIDTAIGCDAQELAQTDLFMWGRHFRQSDAPTASTLLPPDAVGSITEDGGRRLVRIAWQDVVEGETDDRFVEISVAIR